MIKRRLSVLCILGSLSTFSLSPISDSQAVLSALAAGAIGGVVTYNANYGSTNERLLVTALMSGAVTALGYSIACRFTPIGRYQRAMDEIAVVAGDELFSRNFSGYQELRHYLQLRYPTDWYLVAGKLRLFKLFDKLCWADETLKHASTEKTATPQLIELCKAAGQSLVPLFRKYAQLLPLIESDLEEYHQQRRHYDAYLKRKALLETDARQELHYWNSFAHRERLSKEKMNALQCKIDN